MSAISLIFSALTLGAAALGASLDCDAVLTTRCPETGKPVDQRICYTTLYKNLPADLTECKKKLEFRLDFSGPLGGIDIRYRNGRPPDSQSPDLVALAKMVEQFPQMIPEERTTHLNRLADVKKQFDTPAFVSKAEVAQGPSDFSEVEAQIQSNRRSRYVLLGLVVFGICLLGVYFLRRNWK